jgi:hypothetical protein
VTTSEDGLADDPERAAELRAIAADVRGDGSERKQLSALLYRVSDLYDPDEEATPVGVYRAFEHMARIKSQGGIERKDG